MRYLAFPGAVIAISLVAFGCGEANAPLSPGGLQDRIAAAPAQSNGSTIPLNMLDACDQASFDAAVGPGTCARNGGMKFSQFVDLLTRHHTVQAWSFAPATINASVGESIVATNKGGEAHSFTEVAAFGGGFVDLLNQLSGSGATVPECQNPDDVVGPGGKDTEVLDKPGEHKFQCCIHPWMRATVQVS
jgi:plastocyanin